MGDTNLGPLAREIIVLWFTSAFFSEDGKTSTFDTPAQYFSALMWSAMHAHPPGLSGGYFGHWKYPPDN
jgi:hypothetical protein